MCDHDVRTFVVENAVSVDNDNSFNHRGQSEQSGNYVQIDAGKEISRSDVLPYGVGAEDSQGLVRPKEYLE